MKRLRREERCRPSGTREFGFIKDQFSNTKIEYLNNPRKELRSNDLRVTNKKFLDLGLDPIKLNSDKLVEVYDYIRNNKTEIRKESIFPSSFW